MEDKEYSGTDIVLFDEGIKAENATGTVMYAVIKDGDDAPTEKDSTFKENITTFKAKEIGHYLKYIQVKKQQNLEKLANHQKKTYRYLQNISRFRAKPVVNQEV